jgi:hypothetical protein
MLEHLGRGLSLFRKDLSRSEVEGGIEGEAGEGERIEVRVNR